MNTARTMYQVTTDPAGFETQTAELKIAVRKAKAVASVFAEKFTENDTRRNLEAVTREPETFAYLFHILQDLLYDAVTLGESLDA